MKTKYGRDYGMKNNLTGVKFSDLRTTGMILKDIENELKPKQMVSNVGKLSDKVLLGDWIPWHSGMIPVKEIPKKKWLSIEFLIERTIGKRVNKVSKKVVG
jgi:hypothetical protein